MFSCKICGHQSTTAIRYVNHTKIHANIPNIQLPCCAPDCQLNFKRHSGLKTHVYRHHKECGFDNRLGLVDLSCHIDLCTDKCDSLSAFYAHLKGHIKEGRSIVCPFMGCDSTFTVVSTFTSHLSRKGDEGQWEEEEKLPLQGFILAEEGDGLPLRPGVKMVSETSSEVQLLQLQVISFD